jgi:hypothetical protein
MVGIRHATQATKADESGKEINKDQWNEVHTIDDNTINISKLLDGIDGELITYDANGKPAHVAVGTSGQVLKSNGPGAAPTFQDESGGGGSGDFTDKIPLVMMAAEAAGVAFPATDVLVTAVSRTTGWVFPDGSDASSLNLKCMVPSQLASSPAAKLVFVFMTKTAETAANARFTVEWRAIADGESVDGAMTAETEVSVAMPAAIETMKVYSETLGSQPSADDFLLVQITRDPTDASDTYAGDIQLIEAYLEISRTTV